MSLDGGDFAAGVKLPHDARAADDYIIMPTHTGTHVDALAHVWTGDQLYNGHSANYVRSYGATRCGIDKLGPLVGRGVLLDVASTKGIDVLEPGYEITAEDLEECVRTLGVDVGEGDIVLVRTGWLKAHIGNPESFHTDQPGLGLGAGRWLASRDVVAVGADNSAVEVMSWNGRRSTPNVVHQALIRDFGIPLIELMTLEGPAEDKVYEFLLVIASLPIKGGVGSPVNPIAIA
jgi:kynurenine formamidase